MFVAIFCIFFCICPCVHSCVCSVFLFRKATVTDFNYIFYRRCTGPFFCSKHRLLSEVASQGFVKCSSKLKIKYSLI